MNTPPDTTSLEPQEVQPDVEFITALGRLTPADLDFRILSLAQMARAPRDECETGYPTGRTTPTRAAVRGERVDGRQPFWNTSVPAWRRSGRPRRRRRAACSTYDRDRKDATDGWGTQTAIQWEISGLVHQHGQSTQVFCRYPLKALKPYVWRSALRMNTDKSAWGTILHHSRAIVIRPAQWQKSYRNIWRGGNSRAAVMAIPGALHICETGNDISRGGSRRSGWQCLAIWRTFSPRLKRRSNASARAAVGKTVANYVESLTAFCDWCVTHQYLAVDPLQALGRLATTPQTHRRAMTVAEIQRLLEVASVHRRLTVPNGLPVGITGEQGSRSLTLAHLDRTRHRSALGGRVDQKPPGELSTASRPARGRPLRVCQCWVSADLYACSAHKWSHALPCRASALCADPPGPDAGCRLWCARAFPRKPVRGETRLSRGTTGVY